MGEEIKISVIVPVFNAEDYLHVCLNSILKQTYQNFEIICIDDCSTDSSLEILEYFQIKDSRIKILKNDVNSGPGFSRNKGLNIAKGKYISFLDSDDWFSSDAFEILIEIAEKNNTDILMFKTIVFYDTPQEFGMEGYYDMKFMDKFENRVFNHWELDKSKLFALPNAPWNKIYLKSFLNENDIYFPNENLIHEDNPFFYKAITSAQRVSLINKYLINRRRRSGSIMELNNEILFGTIKIFYNIINFFMDNPNLYQYYKKEVLTYIVGVLNFEYNKIDVIFKEKFFDEIQFFLRTLKYNFGLNEDILNNADKNVLDRFNFEKL